MGEKTLQELANYCQTLTTKRVEVRVNHTESSRGWAPLYPGIKGLNGKVLRNTGEGQILLVYVPELLKYVDDLQQGLRETVTLV